MKKSFVILILTLFLHLTKTFSLSIWEQRFGNQFLPQEKSLDARLKIHEILQLKKLSHRLDGFKMRMQQEAERHKLEEERKRKQREHMKQIKMFHQFVEAHFGGDLDFLKDLNTNRMM